MRPTRRYAWKAHLLDGSIVDELDGPDGHRFDDLHRERLARLALEDARTGSEVLAIDAFTGELAVRGRTLAFRLGHVALTGRAHASYRDVFQHKRAHAAWRPGAPARTAVDSHHLGYRAALPEALFRLEAVLEAATGRVRLRADVARRGPVPGADARFVALVDGAPVEGEAALAALLDAPPGDEVPGPQRRGFAGVA